MAVGLRLPAARPVGKRFVHESPPCFTLTLMGSWSLAFGLLVAVTLSPQIARSQGNAPAPSGQGQGAAPAATPRRARASAQAHRAAGPEVVTTGFETLPDGSTQFFVDLSQPVTPVSKPAAAGGLTIVLAGTQVVRRNNLNPLVTVDFNTPVTSARLVPHAHELWWRIALRAPVVPTITAKPTPEGTTRVALTFPKGDYLPVTPTAPTAGGPTAGGPTAGGPTAGAPTPSSPDRDEPPASGEDSDGKR